jgi:hypothetical protein
MYQDVAKSNDPIMLGESGGRLGAQGLELLHRFADDLQLTLDGTSKDAIILVSRYVLVFRQIQ